ncbi:hypothetical protein LCGC14_2779340, partial [marine sediment metagenome]
MKRVQFKVNGLNVQLDVENHQTLLYVLREMLHLKGTRSACELGDCGSCTVILDSISVNSCLVLAIEAEGSTIETIEGLAKDGQVHPLQQAFVDHGAVQCGFCTSGMIMAAKAFLDKNPKPSEAEVRHGLSGNL